MPTASYNKVMITEYYPIWQEGLTRELILQAKFLTLFGLTSTCQVTYIKKLFACRLICS